MSGPPKARMPAQPTAKPHPPSPQSRMASRRSELLSKIANRLSLSSERAAGWLGVGACVL
jgi:hypothetical protein